MTNMQILRIKANHYKNCSNGLHIDFVPTARKTEEDKNWNRPRNKSTLASAQHSMDTVLRRRSSGHEDKACGVMQKSLLQVYP